MSESPSVRYARELVVRLQERLATALDQGRGNFKHIEWLRDGGSHGGGSRYACEGDDFFNRASVNVSHIHYDDLPEKRLASATALSTIIHPRNPHAPSLHMHISWTEMKDGKGYWRMMADLNPSIEKEEDTRKFNEALAQAAQGELLAEALEQGGKYFHIPALGRHRGAAHFYLEQYNSGSREADQALAERLGQKVIRCYLELLENRSTEQATDGDRERQLAYHTLYLFQVLTLDRGTTSGLMVHDQNDLGIMGSIPARVDRSLLASWRERMRVPQDELLDALVATVPENGDVNDQTRLDLAKAVREHYRRHPEALSMQAAGNSTPPTVENHRG